MDVDIWAWVGDTQRQLHEAGNAGLALALGDLPAQALEGRYTQLDVMAPAVAQQAEIAGLPWLQFFARYWHLLGRIGDRAQGEVALGDARELVEFARREDVRDCPAAPAAVEALAIAQAKVFAEVVDITGVVLTKLDGTAKGGIIFAIAQALQLPIRFVGVGEGVEDLRPFNAEEFVAALLDQPQSDS